MRESAIKALCIGLLWCAAGTFPSGAVHANEILKGTNGFALVIEDLNADLIQCGVDKGRLEAAVRFIVQQSRMKFAENTPWAIHLSISGIRTGDTCFAAPLLEVLDKRSVNASGNRGLSSLWVLHGSRVGPRGLFAGDLAATVENLTKRLVADWSSFN